MLIEETRRSFLRSKCLATVGAAGGAFLAMASGRTAVGQASEAAGLGTSQSTSPEQRLRKLGIELPPPPRPVGVTSRRYAPATYCSRPATPRVDSTGSPLVGNMTVEDGHAAARIAGLNLLSSVRYTLGSLDGGCPGRC